MNSHDNTDALPDTRMACVGAWAMLGPHYNDGHLICLQRLTTMRIDAWRSLNRKPGAINDGPLKKPVACDEAFNIEGKVLGHLGERDCMFDKASSTILFGNDSNIVKRKGMDSWSEKPPKRYKILLTNQYAPKDGISEGVPIKIEKDSKSLACGKKHREKNC